MRVTALVPENRSQEGSYSNRLNIGQDLLSWRVPFSTPWDLWSREVKSGYPSIFQEGPLPENDVRFYQVPEVIKFTCTHFHWFWPRPLESTCAVNLCEFWSWQNDITNRDQLLRLNPVCTDSYGILEIPRISRIRICNADLTFNNFELMPDFWSLGIIIRNTALSPNWWKYRSGIFILFEPSINFTSDLKS